MKKGWQGSRVDEVPRHWEGRNGVEKNECVRGYVCARVHPPSGVFFLWVLVSSNELTAQLTLCELHACDLVGASNLEAADICIAALRGRPRR